MKNNDKKERAIVLGATGNMAFAVANVLIGLKKHSPDLKADIKIFTDDEFSQKDKDLINSFYPSEFIEYNFPNKEEILSGDESIKKYSLLTFSRYECFSMLDMYKQVLWIDIDILIQRDISSIFEYKNGQVAVALMADNVGINFNKNIENYDMTCRSYNTGIFLFNDTLLTFKELKKWCYEKTIELKNVIRCADQGILNLMFQEFDIIVESLDNKYNCHPCHAQANEAVIVHSFSPEKFWNFHDFKEWNENNKIWVKMGGSKYSGKRASLWAKYKYKHFPTMPNPFRNTRSFFKYIKEQLEKKCDKNVH